MKEIKAFIRPYRLDAVLDALHAHPELPGVTVSRVRGFGRTVGRRRGEAEPVQYGTTEMVKIECVVNDDEVEAVVSLIEQAARTGRAGDGKVFVYGVEQAVRIRTGERLGRLD